jgi:hypothetical protein
MPNSQKPQEFRKKHQKFKEKISKITRILNTKISKTSKIQDATNPALKHTVKSGRCQTQITPKTKKTGEVWRRKATLTINGIFNQKISDVHSRKKNTGHD